MKSFANHSSDDFKVQHTKSIVIQGNEYYPFGMQTVNCWTRENNTANNFLANGGTEYNATSSLYDLDYRTFDPVLGRMNGVDPMAAKYAGLSPYNYAFNDPVNFADPGGADPSDPNYAYNPGGTDYGDPNWLTRFVWSGYVEGIYTGYDVAVNRRDVAYYSNDVGRVYREFGESLSFGSLSYSSVGQQMRQYAQTYGLDSYAQKYGETGELYERYNDWYVNGQYQDSQFLGYSIHTTNDSWFFEAMQEPTLPSTSELDRRFGPSFKKFVNNVLYKNFPPGSGEPTETYMNEVVNFISSQNWQMSLEDADNPGKGHYLQLAEIRAKILSTDKGTIFSADKQIIEYPPNGPRIIRNGMPFNGVVHNPGIDGTGQIMIQISPVQFMLILVEFNYIFPY